jgi:hypothetical protein
MRSIKAIKESTISARRLQLSVRAEVAELDMSINGSPMILAMRGRATIKLYKLGVTNIEQLKHSKWLINSPVFIVPELLGTTISRVTSSDLIAFSSSLRV